MDELHNWKNWIGTDEAGKGDYFGPLVVAGVYINKTCRDDFIKMSIIDGKKLSNQRIRKIADWIWENYEDNVYFLKKMPYDYNANYKRLYDEGKNLNNMLAQMHVDVIQNLANRTKSKYALVDKFPKHDILTPLLKQRDIKIKLENGAERDIAVAAASIIARDTFLNSINSLSEKYQLKLPRGAYRVASIGREFVKLYGEKSLKKVAKLHFRTTNEVLSEQHTLC